MSREFMLDICSATRYIERVIKTFKHAGLEKFFLTGSKAGIQPAHAKKLSLQLATLNAASSPLAMSLPGWNLHQLHGEFAGHWAVKVDRMWRMTFRFEGADAVLIDYQDYH